MNNERPSLQGKIALIVGGTRGIGRATALELARLGATIVIVGRDNTVGERTQRELNDSGGRGDFITADVSRMSEVQRLAAVFQSRYEHLHLLIHTADVIQMKRVETPEGIELSFALNYLSRFSLNQLLGDVLKRSAPARILHLAAPGIPGKLEMKNIPPGPQFSSFAGHTIGQKANDVYCIEMAERLKETGVTINVLNPGLVDTDLRRRSPDNKLMFRISEFLLKPLTKTPEQFAARVLTWAIAAETVGRSGQLIGTSGRPLRLRNSVTDPTIRRQLFERSEQIILQASPANALFLEEK